MRNASFFFCFLQRSPPIWLETRSEAQELNVVVDRPRGIWTIFSESTRQAQEERRPSHLFSVGPYGAFLPLMRFWMLFLF
jgi:hypothetical protein